jgi:hypothetical protein
MAGKAAVKHNRFVQLSGGTRSVNRTLEAKAGALALAFHGGLAAERCA